MEAGCSSGYVSVKSDGHRRSIRALYREMFLGAAPCVAAYMGQLDKVQVGRSDVTMVRESNAWTGYRGKQERGLQLSAWRATELTSPAASIMKKQQRQSRALRKYSHGRIAFGGFSGFQGRRAAQPEGFESPGE